VLELDRYISEAGLAKAPAVAVGVCMGDRSNCLVVGAPRDAQFRIASLTKPFLAEMTLLLCEKRLLDLDAPALPGTPTIRQLLAHEGGLRPDLLKMERFGEGGDALAAAVREVLNEKRHFAAGRAWEYANSGYWIVAHAAARAAEAEFERVLNDELLQPLGLTDTGWVGERLISGHDERLEQVEPMAYPRSRRPSGGLVSTIDDVVRFGVAALDRRRRRLDDPLRATLFGARSGLGWQVDPAGAVSYHDGDYGGFCARIAVAPDRKVVVVAMASTSAARRSIRQLSERLLCDLSVPLAPRPRRHALALSAYTRLLFARTAFRLSSASARPT
jgi:CubicO group peptidase (beta-lactamase class C family)